MPVTSGAFTFGGHSHNDHELCSTQSLYSNELNPDNFGCTLNRVTTHLENLEKSGNSKVVRENRKSRGKVRGSEIRCIFSSSKYSKTRFSAGADPAGGAYDAPPDHLVG